MIEDAMGYEILVTTLEFLQLVVGICYDMTSLVWFNPQRNAKTQNNPSY